MRAPLLPLLLATVALLAGCIGPGPRTDDGRGPTGPTDLPADGNTTNETNGTAPPRSMHTVRVIDNAYEPANLTVGRGEPITFTNVGQAMHTVTIRKQGDEGEIADQMLDAGQSSTVQLEEPGTYQLRCVYHSASYEEGPQIGTITVA